MIFLLTKNKSIKKSQVIRDAKCTHLELKLKEKSIQKNKNESKDIRAKVIITIKR